MRAFLIALALAVIVAPGLARAKAGAESTASNSLSYSYLRASRVSQQSEYFHDGADGYALRGSWRVNENIYLLVDAARLEFAQLPATQRTYGAGIGYQENPMGDISAFVQAEYFRTRVEFAPSSLGGRTDGWARFSWGFRTLLGKDSPWELDGAVYYDARDDFGDHDFGAWVGIGVVWDHVGLRLVGDHNGPRETVRLGLSVYF